MIAAMIPQAVTSGRALAAASAAAVSGHDKEEYAMCANFGFDFDNDGIMSWEDDYGQSYTLIKVVR